MIGLMNIRRGQRVTDSSFVKTGAKVGVTPDIPKHFNIF